MVKVMGNEDTSLDGYSFLARRIALVLTVGASVSACASLSETPIGERFFPSHQENIRTSELDPIDAPPPQSLGGDGDLLLVSPAETADSSTQGSQRVPLGQITEAPDALSQQTAVTASAPPLSTAKEDPRSTLQSVPMEAAAVPAKRNVIRRFETLKRLQEEELITQQEYITRREANAGALLPYTRDSAAMGLERSVPGTDAIIARLSALKRAFEMRAISAQQHALERTIILNALLPESPEQRELPKPPPQDVLHGAAMVGNLADLRRKNLITSSEFERERAAIEQVLRTGTLPTQAAISSGSQSEEVDSARSRPPNSQSEQQTPTQDTSSSSAQITGPVLHIASFRSEESARQGWDQVLERNPDVLQSLQPIIRRVDLWPGQGIFYRLMAGTFNSVADAEAKCIKLKENNQFCRASADGN